MRIILRALPKGNTITIPYDVAREEIRTANLKANEVIPVRITQTTWGVSSIKSSTCTSTS